WFKSLTLIPWEGDYSLPVAWTLSFELFFYLLLGISLTLPKPSWRWSLLAAPSLLALLLSAAGASVEFGKVTGPITLLVAPYQMEFLLGCGVAVLASQRLHWISLLRGNAVLQATLLSLAAVLLFMPFPVTIPYRFALILVLASLIVSSALRDYKRLPGLAVIAWVGKISYSLYLLHGPIQSLAVRLAMWLKLSESAAALLLVALPILAAVVYFQIVEAWSLRLIQRVTPPSVGINTGVS
ncbi:acyltransferase family protein, partial [Synechococcus sp. AH-551-G15]|nr:acyltransferase family protein [Synechococcus sp. AH-551-G15]